MATNRSRRLRKKLCVDEFQELGFEINLTYREGIESKAVDDFLEAFISEAMEANELGYIGGEDYGFVCLARRGSVTEEQRAKVDAWLKGRSELAEYNVSPLMDVWYPENPIRTEKWSARRFVALLPAGLSFVSAWPAADAAGASALR